VARQRRAYLLIGIALLAAGGGVQYYLSNIFAPANNGSNAGVPPGAGTPLQGPFSPGIAVRFVYAAVGNDKPDIACLDILSGQGGLEFARDFGAASCADAVHKEATKVTNNADYAGTVVPVTAVHETGSSATVYSCAMDISDGDSLGTFLLANTSNGWIITGHRPDPPTCPTRSR